MDVQQSDKEGERVGVQSRVYKSPLPHRGQKKKSTPVYKKSSGVGGGGGGQLSIIA